ncbi:hypothetical protein ZIOFF_012169 [Zingiber officinale]|uniref:Uncharacterized protein n=1 Tax=Zingiber officinale TaxID=94328 RepID=A0A8J5M090_ZINOF|nr:hypothetical protein ZIOFF_012169 [Zingiber officinale]
MKPRAVLLPIDGTGNDLISFREIREMLCRIGDCFAFLCGFDSRINWFPQGFLHYPLKDFDRIRHKNEDVVLFVVDFGILDRDQSPRSARVKLRFQRQIFGLYRHSERLSSFPWHNIQVSPPISFITYAPVLLADAIDRSTPDVAWPPVAFVLAARSIFGCRSLAVVIIFAGAQPYNWREAKVHVV